MTNQSQSTSTETKVTRSNTGIFTVTVGTPAIFTKTTHGFSSGNILTFYTSGALPTGLKLSTSYYVISTGLTADAFEVSTSLNGSAVNISGTQSGTHFVEKSLASSNQAIS